MPSNFSRSCTRAGCAALSKDGTGRCEKHPREAWVHASGANSNARGYGAAWRKLRLIVMARDNGLCQCPECLGGLIRVTPAHEVDHIVSKARADKLGWTQTQVDALSNLRAVNHACHVRITQLEQGRTPSPVNQFDKSGHVVW